MSHPNVSIRKDVRPGDPDVVREITDSTGFFYPDETDVAVELVTERLEKGPSSGYHFCFAEVDSRTVGYTCFGPIACTKASFDLYWIVVHADYRGGGIGKILMAETEKAMGEMGCKRIYVETSSRDQYKPTRAFYLHFGYEEDAVLEDFYGPEDSKVIYRKILPERK